MKRLPKTPIAKSLASKKKPFTWSLSRLKDYEKCPALYKMRHIVKGLPEPKSPAMERGTHMHTFMENAILKGDPLPKNLLHWAKYAAEIAARKNLEVEQMWGFDRDLKPCDPFSDTVWLRVKMDACDRDGAHAHGIDWKTGGVYPDHADGMLVYAMAIFLRYKSVKTIDISLEYLDKEYGDEFTVERAELKEIKATFLKRVKVMESDTRFIATPGKGCRWCMQNPSKGGTCAVAKQGW